MGQIVLDIPQRINKRIIISNEKDAGMAVEFLEKLSEKPKPEKRKISQKEALRRASEYIDYLEREKPEELKEDIAIASDIRDRWTRYK